MGGLEDGSDAARGASGPPEQSAGFQLCEGTFSRRPQPCVITVELLVVPGLFAVVVVGGANGDAGSLTGPVREHEDLPGQARLDDAVGSRCGQAVGAPRCGTREPEWGSVRPCDDLDAHAVLPVCFVPAQMRKGEQGLLESAQLPPGRSEFTPSSVDEPGDMLDELVRDVGHGRVQNRQGPSVAGVTGEITTPTTKGPVLSRPGPPGHWWD